MCGIVGVVSEPACGPIYEALMSLQHRGQDAAGIVTDDSGRLCLRKDNGMVRDVFDSVSLQNLSGNVGIGHVRYPTAGTSSCAEAQPFYVNSPYGIALAHNGNLVNAEALKEEMAQEFRHINTTSDSEVLLNLFAAALASRMSMREPGGVGLQLPTDDELFEAVKVVMTRAIGGYSVCVIVAGYGLVCWRDPNGIRPLCYGKRVPEVDEPPAGTFDYMASSESGTLSSLGFELVGDVPPGHMLLLPRGGRAASMLDCLPAAVERPLHAPCVFEYVYFARPDSVLDGVSVYRTRLRMGVKLAEHILSVWPEHDIDVVVPVPDTARTSALECAATLGIKYREGFIKNRYVGRTFIMPAQGLRKKSVRQKLSAIASELQGRNVLLVDDSIVRGTTCSQIIAMCRDAGAKRVYMSSASPPVLYPNVYGIDMPTKQELLASNHVKGADISYDEIAKEIGADRVIYQQLADMIAAIVEEAAVQGSPLSALDCSCFDGNYVTSHVGAQYLSDLAAARNDSRGQGGKTTPEHMLDRLESSSPRPPGKA